MVATVILAVIIFVLVVWIFYRRFFKKAASDCSSCEDVGCPLYEMKMRKEKDKE